MKIERGIIGYNNRNEMIVQSPGHIYHLSHEDFYKPSLKEDQKVFGVINDSRFSICREFISDSGEFVFGFLIQNSNPGVIQSILEYDPIKYNPYESGYQTGPQFQIPV